MSIKFILDETSLSKDRQEIEKILESLNQQPYELKTKSNFLRKFILASINTFKPTYNPIIKDVSINVDNLNTLKAPEKINFDFHLEIPNKLEIPLELILTAPKKFNVPEALLRNTPSAPNRRLILPSP